MHQEDRRPPACCNPRHPELREVGNISGLRRRARLIFLMTDVQPLVAPAPVPSLDAPCRRSGPTARKAFRPNVQHARPAEPRGQCEPNRRCHAAVRVSLTGRALERYLSNARSLGWPNHEAKASRSAADFPPRIRASQRRAYLSERALRPAPTRSQGYVGAAAQPFLCACLAYGRPLERCLSKRAPSGGDRLARPGRQADGSLAEAPCDATRPGYLSERPPAGGGGVVRMALPSPRGSRRAARRAPASA